MVYDLISRLAALSVGGEARFRQLALQGLTINPETKVLDLCCGSGNSGANAIFQDVTDDVEVEKCE